MKSPLSFRFLILPLFLLLFILVANFTPLGKLIKNFSYSAVSQVEKMLWSAGSGLSELAESVFKFQALSQEAAGLRLENEELLNNLVYLSKIKKENEDLRRLLDFGLEKEFDLEIVNVIAKDASRDSLLINKGEENGLAKGMAVITSQKVIVGKVGEVYANFSEMILVTSKDFSFGAGIFGKEVYGLVRGKGGLSLSFELIPKEAEILEGDLIISSNLGRVFPENLLVGKVKSIDRTDAGTFQSAQLEPLLRLNEMDNLFIVKDF